MVRFDIIFRENSYTIKLIALYAAIFSYYVKNRGFLPPETEHVNLSIEPSL
jgi:hypothetical protein